MNLMTHPVAGPQFPPRGNQYQLFVFRFFFFKTSLIQGGKLNESAIHENLATHKLLLSQNPSSKELDDLCLNIYKNYTAIEFEIAKRNLDFAVVSNVGYAPFYGLLLYLLLQRGVDV